MEIRYNITGDARRAFVKAICEITGEPSRYLRVPSCAYAIGERYRVTKEGNLEISDGAPANTTAWLMAELEKRGYTAEPVDEVELVIEGTDEESDEPVGFSIGMSPTELSDKPFSAETLDKLNAIVKGYEELFKKAIGTSNSLKTEFDDDTIWFDWFDRLISKDEQKIYTEFFKALYRFAQNAKRVDGKRSEVENEKFTMRTFLNRIGLSGSEHKQIRRQLLKNLSGSSAFRYGRAKEGSITTICYGKTESWNTRQEACDSFLEAMNGSDGSERERYTTIYTKLMAGMTVCSDEDE
ncbi:MAG: hypothetical protein ACI38A_11860 [Candidatus Ornithomonoglobus sp.]